MTNDPRVDEPCHAAWDAMTPHLDQDGLGAGRFCDACQRSVIDLSGRTEKQVKRLVERAERRGDGSVCVRFPVDADGAIVYAPAPRLFPAAMLARARRVLATAALPMAVAACDNHDEAGATAPPSTVSPTGPTTTAHEAPAPVATWTVEGHDERPTTPEPKPHANAETETPACGDAGSAATEAEAGCGVPAAQTTAPSTHPTGSAKPVRTPPMHHVMGRMRPRRSGDL
jgi:hypothetical protein